jgi:nicotinamide mononucleotide adenylyltransferase
MNGLVIGRFEPVHYGHVEFLKEVDKMQLEKIILGIGEEGIGRTPWNPFTYEEVKQMWLPELGKLTTDVELYKIPDINDGQHYASHVEKITGCNEKDTLILSGNGATLDCFTNHGKNYKTHSVGYKIPTVDGYLCATKIRDMICKDKDWQRYVPESTKKVIEAVDGVNIIKNMGEKYERT